ncbi:hypothetical protein PHYPSEUDO_014893 [Phytophthora pseudosyringae]|uniref:Uncharacterized protein n=1 Tax=Phytophthora pseudosyringae TaxID=221518 RepID=A0A8T1V6E3_9STRA|nr:hypothetical protein PHYPSEUDO_014893 [Phytophthora pseudosyringae]
MGEGLTTTNKKKLGITDTCRDVLVHFEAARGSPVLPPTQLLLLAESIKSCRKHDDSAVQLSEEGNNVWAAGVDGTAEGQDLSAEISLLPTPWRLPDELLFPSCNE